MFKKTHSFKTFIWKGIDNQGFCIRGEAIATDLNVLNIELRQKQIHLLSARMKSNLLFRMKNRIRSQSITHFLKELSTLLQSGIPLLKALDIICQNQKNPYFKELLVFIRLEVEKGKQLSEALNHKNLYFDNILCHLVSAAEQSGTLEEVLNYLVNYREKVESLKRKLKRALCYPVIILMTSILVSILMLTLIIPKFAFLFQSFGAPLPLLTVMVIQVSNGIRHFGFMLVMIILIFIAIFNWYLRHSICFRRISNQYILKLPLIGSILQQTTLAHCLQTLSLLLKTGIPIDLALQITAKIAKQSTYYQEFSKMSQQVKLGKTLCSTLTSDLFPIRVKQFVSIGEESGTLDKMLYQLANYFSEQVDYITSLLMQMLEPLLMLILCVIIGVLIIAMYLPIFRLGSLV